MGDSDKPFACSEPNCNMRFTTEDHLGIHKQKHKMSLTLTPGTGKLLGFADQTPTPTKFLRYGEEIGLFSELTKNPFEESFKQALEGNVIKGFRGLPTTPNEGLPIPGPSSESDTLNTPNPMIFSQVSQYMQNHREAFQPKPSRLADPEPDFVVMVDGDISMVSPRKHTQEEALNLSKSFLHTAKSKPVYLKSPDTSSQGTMEMPDSPEQVVEVVTDVSDLSQSQMSTEDESGAISDGGVVISDDAGLTAHQTTAGEITVGPTATNPESQMVQLVMQVPGGQLVPLPMNVINIQPSPQKTEKPATTVKATPLGASELTKQKLKEALQHNIQQNIFTDNMKVLTEAADRVTSNKHKAVSLLKGKRIMEADTSTNKRPRIPDFMEDDHDERRRKFLERNKAAAQRCRAKKKQWLNTVLQQVEETNTSNSDLQTEVSRLKEENAQLKALLLQHKDCPITLQQKNTVNLVSPDSEVISIPPNSTVTVPPTAQTTTKQPDPVSKQTNPTLKQTQPVTTIKTIPVPKILNTNAQAGTTIPVPKMLNNTTGSATTIPVSKVLSNTTGTTIPVQKVLNHSNASAGTTVKLNPAQVKQLGLQTLQTVQLANKPKEGASLQPIIILNGNQLVTLPHFVQQKPS